MDVATSRIIEALLLPPGGLMLLVFIGLLFSRWKFGRWTLALALLSQWLLSLPITADLLYLGLETHPPISQAEIEAAAPEAIVVLSGGRHLNAPEYAGDTASEHTLTRLRYAAKIAKQTGLPIIPSGGDPGVLGVPEAKISRDILRNEFAVEVKEIEPHSNTTWENARYTAQLLKELGIHEIILVTEAAHMSRALYAFERNGIKPLPAPTHYQSITPQEISPVERYLPSGRAVRDCTSAIHEYLGLFWYRMK